MPADDLQEQLNALQDQVQQLANRLGDEREERERRDAEGTPIGTIAAFGADRIPSGWLPCDGGRRKKADFPKLYEAIQNVWGAASDLEFSLPDLRARFLRGLDAGAGRDTEPRASVPNRAADAVGSVQEDQFLLHDHQVNDPGHSHGINDPGHAHGIQWSTSGGASTAVYERAYNDGGDPRPTTLPAKSNVSVVPSTTSTTIVPRGGRETRPKNAYVLWMIESGSGRSHAISV